MGHLEFIEIYLEYFFINSHSHDVDYVGIMHVRSTVRPGYFGVNPVDRDVTLLRELLCLLRMYLSTFSYPAQEARNLMLTGNR